jgi:DNA-binding transcriptional MerR regulator
MTTFSQITMKFVEDSNRPTEAQENLNTPGDQPVNVGVRLKKLKSAEPAPDTGNLSEPAAEVFTPSTQEDPVPSISISLDPEEDLMLEESVIEYKSVDPALKIKSGRGRKSIKQISEEADLIQIPEDEILFQKHYYTMGEVADMFRVNQSLLRFWEAEFAVLQPKKNKKGDRYFRPVDIKNLHLIYHLLRQRKYTIEGAKDFLKNNKKSEEKFETIKKLEEVKRFLLEMRANIR